MRLIDADALNGYILTAEVGKVYRFCFPCKEIQQAIDEQPTVEERKKGKWIKMSDADGVYWACSECGEDIPRVPHYNPQFDLFHRLESIEKTNFCPNCGADMRGEA